MTKWNGLNTSSTKWIRSMRIIWAVVLKDMLEALKNKNTISVLISGLFIAFMYRGLPLLTANATPPMLAVYNPGDSALEALLENSDFFEVSSYPNLEQLQERLRDTDNPMLALVIPDKFDQSLAAGKPPVLQAYVLEWFTPQEDQNLRLTLEDELVRLTGQSVQVNFEGNVLSLLPDSGGLGVQAGMAAVFASIMVGLSLIAHLFLEEKQTRTLDALLVSPANAGLVVIGKAIVGLIYCLATSLVVLLVNQALVTHWWLAGLAALVGSLFTVSIGLWLGIHIENRAQLSVWSWVLVLPLFFPMVIFLLEDLMPGWLVSVCNWIPTVVFFNLIRTAFANPISLGTIAQQIVYILVWAACILAVVAWQVRRQDRQEPGRLLDKILQNWAKTQEPAPHITHQAVKTTPAAPVSIKTPHTTGLQIILAIAAKDMRDMLKNKLALSIILGTMFIILPNTLLPKLIKNAEKPVFIFYSETGSEIVNTLAGRDAFSVWTTDSREEFNELVIEVQGLILGVALPEDFDQLAGSGQTVQVDGYYTHWSTPDEVQQLAELMAEQLGQTSQLSIQVNLEDHAVYPSGKTKGMLQMNGIIIVIVTSTIGMALVPLLMVEEKEAHTFDAIMVSPANYSQVAAGKWLAGMGYCLIAGLVCILVFAQFIVHWPAVVLTVFLIAAFAVSLGLLIGVISNNTATTGLWGSLAVIFLLSSALAQLYTLEGLPPALLAIMEWLPGTVMLRMFSYTISQELLVAALLQNALLLAGFTAAIFGLSTLQVRRMERR